MNTALPHLPFWLDVLLAALLLAGAGFALLGSWGLAMWSSSLKLLHGPAHATPPHLKNVSIDDTAAAASTGAFIAATTAARAAAADHAAATVWHSSILAF